MNYLKEMIDEMLEAEGVTALIVTGDAQISMKTDELVFAQRQGDTLTLEFEDTEMIMEIKVNEIEKVVHVNNEYTVMFKNGSRYVFLLD